MVKGQLSSPMITISGSVGCIAGHSDVNKMTQVPTHAITCLPWYAFVVHGGIVQLCCMFRSVLRVLFLTTLFSAS